MDIWVILMILGIVFVPILFVWAFSTHPDVKNVKDLPDNQRTRDAQSKRQTNTTRRINSDENINVINLDLKRVNLSVDEEKSDEIQVFKLKATPVDKSYGESKVINGNTTSQLECSVSENSIAGPSIYFNIVGTKYRNDDAIEEARLLDFGDELKLEREEKNLYDKYAVAVYTHSGYHIGYVEREYSKFVFEHINKIKECYVLIKSEHRIPFIDGVVVFLPGVEDPDDLITQDFEDRQIIRKANELKRIEPDKALSILAPLVEREEGIDAKLLCCQCYRIKKDYEAEKAMILKVMKRINSIQMREVDRAIYYSVKNKSDDITRRLLTVESRLESQRKRAEKKKKE